MYNKIDYLSMIHDAILDKSEFLQTLKVLLVFVFSCMLLSNSRVCLFFILPTLGLWAIESNCVHRELLLRALFDDVSTKSIIDTVGMNVAKYKKRVMRLSEIAMSYNVSFFYIATCFAALAKFILFA